MPSARQDCLSTDNALDAGARYRSCVVVVDIVGFSTLMNSDELGAFRRWTSLRDELIKPSITACSGQFVKSTGDGLIATFDTARDGARWAKSIQESSRPVELGLEMRISLNLCEVIRDGDDLIGDGVNIASRLQEFAETGGIIASETVIEELADDREFPFREIGEISLKNIPTPIRAFDLLTGHGSRRRKRPVNSGLPTIAIMPFANLSSGTEDDYFAEGIVEDIVVSLSGLKELVVISSGSTRALSARITDPRDIGRALSVSYVLTGTLSRQGHRIRIASELYDANSAECLFAEKEKLQEDDLFEVQDRIVRRIVSRVAPNVREAEKKRALRKPPQNFNAYDCYLRALDLLPGLSRERFEMACSYLEQAMQVDPEFAMAYAWAARLRTIRLGQGWSANFDADADVAAELAAKAIELDHDNALALATYGHVRSFAYQEYEVALSYLERAISACPNNAVAWMLFSATMSYLRRGRKAVEFAERALSLSPFDPNIWAHYTFLAFAHYANDDFEEAIRWGRRAQVESPRFTSNLRILACSLAATGNIEEAREIGSRLMAQDPTFSIGGFVGAGRPFADPDARAAVARQLMEAGIPD